MCSVKASKRRWGSRVGGAFGRSTRRSSAPIPAPSRLRTSAESQTEGLWDQRPCWYKCHMGNKTPDMVPSWLKSTSSRLGEDKDLTMETLSRSGSSMTSHNERPTGSKVPVYHHGRVPEWFRSAVSVIYTVTRTQHTHIHTDTWDGVLTNKTSAAGIRHRWQAATRTRHMCREY